MTAILYRQRLRETRHDLGMISWTAAGLSYCRSHNDYSLTLKLNWSSSITQRQHSRPPSLPPYWKSTHGTHMGRMCEPCGSHVGSLWVLVGTMWEPCETHLRNCYGIPLGIIWDPCGKQMGTMCVPCGSHMTNLKKISKKSIFLILFLFSHFIIQLSHRYISMREKH